MSHIETKIAYSGGTCINILVFIMLDILVSKISYDVIFDFIFLSETWKILLGVSTRGIAKLGK